MEHTPLRAVRTTGAARAPARPPDRKDSPQPVGPTTPDNRRAFLDWLVRLQLLEPSGLRPFLSQRGERLDEFPTDERLGQALVQERLLTEYQLQRVLAGTTHGLVLGNYRVRERLGAGGMGIVFLAEHRLMHRPVAVKVLPVDDDCPPMVKQRFYAEMRALAELTHPNVVMAFDAGEVPSPDGRSPDLIYLVMELVEGGDLERHVLRNGPCGVGEACNYVRQAACGLQAAHDRHLIHRDIKPSNLLLTATGQVKLVDFGLAREFTSRLTEPGVLLGSVEFMPPEQSLDPSAVSKAADIYGLGATLFWLVTGHPPYPSTRNIGSAVRSLQHDQPRRLRQLRPEAPEALDDLLARMLDRDPARRPESPLAVLNALTPFLVNDPAYLVGAGGVNAVTAGRRDGPVAERVSALAPRRRVLVVDDEPQARVLHRSLVEMAGCKCTEAPDGKSALDLSKREPFDLVLLDLHLPDLSGYEVCRLLRERPENANLKIIIVSGCGDHNDLSEALPRGADDYIAKPFQPRQLLAKVKHAFRLKEAQDRARVLSDQLLLTNQLLQQSLGARAADVREAHNALLFAMAKMAEDRDGETPGHLRRMRRYAAVLARQAALALPWSGLVDERFLQQLDGCVPLHDIGKIGLPDQVLLKPGALNSAERQVMETHTTIGDRILAALARDHGNSLEFLGMARAIVRHHHERFDGEGYPDGLAGDAIPPAARLVAVADVYDALRRQRRHKPAMSHAEAVRVLEESEGQFDPDLMRAFASCRAQFERIYEEIKD
jgi:putative two-component system response regulator